MTKRGRSDSTSSIEQELFKSDSESDYSDYEYELEEIELEKMDLERLTVSGSRAKSSRFEEGQKLSVEEASRQEQNKMSGRQADTVEMMKSRNQEFDSTSSTIIKPAFHSVNSGVKLPTSDQKDVKGNEVEQNFTFSPLDGGSSKGGNSK